LGYVDIYRFRSRCLGSHRVGNDDVLSRYALWGRLSHLNLAFQLSLLLDNLKRKFSRNKEIVNKMDGVVALRHTFTD
jgi:hypothetical protein